MQIPSVWTEPFSNYIENGLKNEAAKLFRIHQLPDDLESWRKYRVELRERIWKNLGVRPDHSLDIDLRETGEIQMAGYVVKKIYFQSRPGLYVTGNLYIPDGDGPFPAIIACMATGARDASPSGSGTRAQPGQERLCQPAGRRLGSGERSTEHGNYEYHGAGLGGALFNIGETLMGAQIVDNMRAVDVLCSLAYVDSDRIG